MTNMRFRAFWRNNNLGTDVFHGPWTTLEQATKLVEFYRGQNFSKSYMVYEVVEGNELNDEIKFLK